MLSSRNLLKPADGEPIVSPTKDMVLGVYYLTMTRNDRAHKGTGKAFSDIDEVEMAYTLGDVEHSCPDQSSWRNRSMTMNRARLEEPSRRVIDTTVGRVLFNRVLPNEMRFVNRVLDKGAIQELVAEIYLLLREDGTPAIVDAIKDIGFAYATRSGTTMAVSDIYGSAIKEDIINQTSGRHRGSPSGLPARPAHRARTDRTHHRALASYNREGGRCGARDYGSRLAT